MKITCLVLLGFFALATARPSDIINFEVDTDNLEHEHEQEGVAGRAVEGEYSWTAPNGEEYVVKYIADHLGYRIVESNALPIAPEADLAQTRAVEFEAEEDEEDEVAQFRAAEEDEDEDEDEEDDE
ncbi:unnamed protein product [Meganyctiphanes norvegica]|uniref:Uncharacterized protein n=1 Tax=Meganyctiphanes norvegica TaxID=48144 RepID=A0AAV2SNV9_MEGNR